MSRRGFSRLAEGMRARHARAAAAAHLDSRQDAHATVDTSALAYARAARHTRALSSALTRFLLCVCASVRLCVCACALWLSSSSSSSLAPPPHLPRQQLARLPLIDTKAITQAALDLEAVLRDSGYPLVLLQANGSTIWPRDAESCDADRHVTRGVEVLITGRAVREDGGQWLSEWRAVVEDPTGQRLAAATRWLATLLVPIPSHQLSRS
eukprot:1782344-Rhodomonas_salina.1